MSDSAKPESTPTDCERVRHCSLYVRHWIEKQPEVKEESLTDWLLFELSRRIPRIRYKSFSRHEESRVTGADWHWWFVFDRFSFQIRVQAKRLKRLLDEGDRSEGCEFRRSVYVVFWCPRGRMRLDEPLRFSTRT